MEDSLFGKPARNFAPRTIWTGDNLDILRGINSETVDLIYLDPPFNSNRTYSAPVGSKAAEAAFKDTWTLSDLDLAWIGLIADQHPAMHQVIESAGITHSPGMKSYLCMMAVRLLELLRVLAPTGSIYLHCDPTASHYLKLLMDAVFGRRQFRNEILWKRHSGTKSTANRYFSQHDTILYYVKSPEATWNREFEPLTDEEIEASWFRYTDQDGRRYKANDLTAPGDGGYQYEFLGSVRNWRYDKEKMYDLLKRGDVHHKSCTPGAGNQVAVRKRYLDEMKGRPLGTLWTTIKPLNRSSSERTGYPTQKPLALLDRIIKASSNPEDVVLDPFCGCATACVAADNLGREWLGIDISPKAVELVHMRLRDTLGELYHAGLVTARTDIPQRTDIEAPINYRQNRHVLFGEQEGKCNGCQMEFPFKMFEVDHQVPRSRGGTDHKGNLQLLCSPCNRIKGDRPMEYLMARLAEYSRPA